MGSINGNPFNTQPFGGQGSSPTPPESCIPFGVGPGTMVYQALRLSGQLTPGATANPELLADALYEMNKFIDSTNALQNAQYYIDDRYFDITTSQQAYTLGPTGDFSVDANNVDLSYRPQRIIRANLVLLSNTGGQPIRIPIQIIPVEDYSEIPVIDISSQVTIRMYVQTTLDNVTLWCFPFPTVGNQFEFFMWPGFPQFASLTACFDGPPGYQDWFEAALARRMYALNTKDVGVMRRERLFELKANEVAARRIVEGSNAPTLTLRPDVTISTPDGSGAPFNYLYGDYSQ